MADVHIWEKGEIRCRAVGLPPTVKKAKFNFYKATEKVGSVEAKLSKESAPEPPPEPSSETGTPTSEPTPTGQRGVGSTKTQKAVAKFTAPEPGPDDAFVKLTYKIELEGTEKEGFIHDVYVWAKKIKVKSQKEEDGSKLPRAKFKIKQQNPKVSGSKGASELERVTDDEGELEIELVFPAEATITWQRPFAFKSWVKGTASSGRERIAKLERGFIAKLIFPDPSASPSPDPRAMADQSKPQHVQWVNVDPSVETDPPPEWGSKIKIRVGAVNPATVVLNEDKVFLKAKWGSGNLERVVGGPLSAEQVRKGIVSADPDWPVKDKEYKDEKIVSAPSKEVEIELELGPTGGDTVVVEVGGTSDCADAKIEIVSWRMLLYEMKFPACVAPLLDNAVTLPLDPPTVGLPSFVTGLKPETTDWAAERLRKGYVAFYPRASHQVADDDAKVADAILDAAYLKPYTAGTWAADAKVFVYGDWVDRSGGWLKDSNRCVQVTLVHAALSSETDGDGDPVYKPVRKTVTTGADVDLDVQAALDDWLFEHAMGKSDKTPAIKEVRWRAVFDKGVGLIDRLAHPAVSGGKPLSGVIPVDGTNVTRVDCKTLRVKLPADVKKFVGPKGVKKCPVEIIAEINGAYGINGSAGGGKQVMVVGRPAEAIGATICHELGHSMGLTVFPSGSRKKGPPRGLPYPDKVPTGLVYDDSIMHAGSHCAFGIGASDRAKARLGGKSGTCIMFGSGGDEVPPSRDKFCPDCEKHLKARRLSDIRTYYSKRQPEDL